MDTKYFVQALDEWRLVNPYRAHMLVGEMPLYELSNILRRAQELKKADQGQI